MNLTDAASAVDDAILSRRSVRAFLPTPVDRATVEKLLQLASRAASGSNIQPWRVRVFAGEVRERLTKAILEKGLAKGVFADAKSKALANRILDEAKTAVALDKTTLAKQDAAARAKPTGDSDVKLGAAYLSYGDLDKAIEALQRGIGKSGVKNTDEAGLLPAARRVNQLLKGALARAGQRHRSDEDQGPTVVELTAPKGIKSRRVLLLDLGRRRRLDGERAEAAGAALASAVAQAGESEVVLVLDHTRRGPIQNRGANGRTTSVPCRRGAAATPQRPAPAVRLQE